MRIIYATHSNKSGPGQFWSGMIKLAVLFSAAIAVLAVTLIGLFILLPLLLVGGTTLYFVLRNRLRRAQRQQSRDDIIDAEYTVIERREE